MEGNQQRQHLSLAEMNRAVGMLEAGRRQVDVAAALNTSQSVISRLWRRYRTSGDPSEQHPGRGRITTAVQDRYLTLEARRRPIITAKQLLSQLQTTHNVTVCSQTIRNRLHEANLHARRPIRAPPIRHGNRARRVEWAEEHILWTEEQWSRVLFTDESRFGIHPDSRRVRVWRRPGNLERLRCVQDVHSYKGGTVMMWGGICIGGKTDLCFLERFLNADGYLNRVLRPIVLPFAGAVGPEFILMHDNATPHVAGTVTEWLEDENISVLPWPAQSPDLNVIEHVWDMLGRSIESELDEIHTRIQLRDTLVRHWQQLPQDAIDNLILSMPRRCRAVLNQRGGNTLY